MKKTKLISGLWIAVTTLILTTIAFAIAYFAVQDEATEYKNQLEYVYERSFFELVDNVNNIEVNLSKLSASKSDLARKEITAKIISQTNMAQNNLAVLPIDANEIGNTVSFVNYVNGYLTSLNQKLGKSQTLSNDDLENIDNLYETSKKIKDEVNRYAVQVEGEYRIIDNAKSTTYELSKFSQTFSSLKEPSVDYPELIYDGPFSESVLNKKVKGLVYNDITQVEADEIVKKLKDKLKYASFEQAGQGKGKIPSYDYKLRFSDDSRAYMQLTKSGGKLLSYSRILESKTGKQDQEKYVVNAVEFAENMGFENIESVWIEEAKDAVYINLTSKINDVIAYPDLIKVKLSKDKAIVTGFEASAYFYNHTERPSKKAILSNSQAQESLPSDMQVVQSRLVIIPGEYVGELYAYEFDCERNGNRFYIYINADTGEQEKIMRVVDTDDGELLM